MSVENVQLSKNVIKVLSKGRDLNSNEADCILLTAQRAIDNKTNRANPIFSNFYVKGYSGIVGRPDLGGPLFNLEHGGVDAIHGEESAIVILRSQLGSRLPKEIANITFLSEGKDATCCGNCRDAMRDNLNKESLIVNVDKNIPKIRVWRLTDLLVNVGSEDEVFLEDLSPAMINDIDSFTIKDFNKKGFWPYRGLDKPERRYTAILKVGDHEFKSAGFGPADYHSVTPVRHVVADLITGSGKKILKNMKYEDHICLYILSSNIIPDVTYIDRNQLLEVENILSKRFKKTNLTIPVVLVSWDESGSQRIFLTNSREWLPMPFHPRILSK